MRSRRKSVPSSAVAAVAADVAQASDRSLHRVQWCASGFSQFWRAARLATLAFPARFPQPSPARPIAAGSDETYRLRPSSWASPRLQSQQPSQRVTPGAVVAVRSIRSSRAVRLLPSVVGPTAYPPRRSGPESLPAHHVPLRSRAEAAHQTATTKATTKAKATTCAFGAPFGSPLPGLARVFPLSLRA